jgi:transcriptional regulator with XRE-family HTH domain
MINDSFWGRVKPLIKALNMTHEQFANHINVSSHTFKNWIYYNRIPDLTAAYSISAALGVTLDYLIGGKDKNIAEMKMREIKMKKAAAEALKLFEKIQKQLMLINLDKST